MVGWIASSSMDYWYLSKAFSLLESYLSDQYLFVVANGQESSLYPVMARVPQGGAWSLLLFNLCMLSSIPASVLFIGELC